LAFAEQTEELKEWARNLGIDLTTHNGLPERIAKPVEASIRSFARETKAVCEYLDWSVRSRCVGKYTKEDDIEFWNRLPLKAYEILFGKCKDDEKDTLEKKALIKEGRRLVAVLFADLRGFTKVSDAIGMDRPELPAVLKFYFETMWQILLKHGGEVDKFEGDGIMALFGTAYPYDREDEVELAFHATEAAIEMCRAFPATRRKIIKILQEGERSDKAIKKAKKLQLGIGIIAGAAYLDFFGSTWQTTYTALGTVVNHAKKLEGRAARPEGKRKWGNILVALGPEATQEFRKLKRRVLEAREVGRKPQIREAPRTLEEILGAKRRGKTKVLEIGVR
jgi:adenylate cyclase